MKIEGKELNHLARIKLDGLYKSHSFNAMEEVAGFSRNVNEDCKQYAFLGANISVHKIEYTPYFQVENQKIINQIKQILTDEVSLIRGSQGDKLGKRFGVNGYEDWLMYKGENENDLDKMVAHHEGFMNKVGWKFFEQTSTLEGISQYLNEPILKTSVESLSEEEKIRLVRQNGVDSMINGIVSAWLVNEEEFEKLVSNYREIFFPEHIQKSLDILLEGMHQ